MKKWATFSPCRTWRYELGRQWDEGYFALFIGLNPSTADETDDDPTIRRCIRFAKDWGYGGLLMGNLFAYRATKPADMAKAIDPIGPGNDEALHSMSWASRITVAAWGAYPLTIKRGKVILSVLDGQVYALRLTKDGHPGHPLYVPADTGLVRYPG